jgi:RHS repeat-associated protein
VPNKELEYFVSVNWATDDNGDGKSDLVSQISTSKGVQGEDYQAFLTSIVFLNTGSGFDSSPLQLYEVDLKKETNLVIWPSDLNGNGQVDFVKAYHTDYNGSAYLNFDRGIVRGDSPDSLYQITDGLGGQVAVTYKPMSDAQVYTKTADVQPLVDSFRSDALGYPFRQAPASFPFQVVAGGNLKLVQQYVERNFLPDNPDYKYNSYINNYVNKSSPYKYVYSFKYAAAQIDRRGRGWLGFKTVSKLNHQTGRKTVTTYNQQFPKTGTMARIEYQCDSTVSHDPNCTGDNTLLTATQIDYEALATASGSKHSYSKPYPKVYQVLKNKVQFDNYSYGNHNYSRAKTFKYDIYGEQTLLSDLGYVNNQSGIDKTPNDNVYTCTQYIHDESTWKLGYPTAIKVSANSQCNNDFTKFDNDGDFHLNQVAYYTDENRMNVKSHQQWDNTNNVWLKTSYTYDGFGNILSKIQPGNRETTYTYEDQYHTYLKTRTSPLNQHKKRLTEKFGFEPRFGSLVGSVDVNNLTRITCVDDFGRVDKIQGPLPISGNVKADKNCVSSLVTGADSVFTLPEVITLESYTRNYNITPLYSGNYGNPKGKIVEVKHLQNWHSSSERKVLSSSSNLDGLGRSYKQNLQNGATICKNYNSDGQVVEKSTLNYQCKLNIISTYDVYGRLTKKVHPAGNNGKQTSVTTMAYAGGDTTTITYAAEDTYKYQKIFKYKYYNSTRKPYQMIVPGDNNATTVYEYDRIGRLTKVTDPQKVANTIAYDSLNRRIWINNPDQNTTGKPDIKVVKSVYNPVTGFLHSQVDAKAQQTTFEYDGWGRVTKKTLADDTVIEYTYDDPKVNNGLSHLTQVVEKNTSGTQYQYNYTYDRYDNRNQIKLSIADEPHSFITRKEYDPLTRLRQLTYPDGKVVKQTYQKGNLTSLAIGKTFYANFPIYTVFGKPYAIGYGNGMSTGYGYAPTGEMISQTTIILENDNTGQGKKLLDQTLDLNHLNQITTITDNLKSGGTDFTQHFSYQSERLSKANGLYGPRRFEYDKAGNLTNNNGINYSYEAHRVTKGTQKQQTVFEASYDENGNLIEKNMLAKGELWNYQYDVRNRLTEVKKNKHSILSIPLYDYTGRRLKKVDAEGIETLYVSSVYQITKFPDRVKTTKYVTALGETLAAITTIQPGAGNNGLTSADGYPTSGILYFHTDHLSSTTLTTDANGKLSSRRVYLPYGSVYKPKSSGPDNFRPKFQGQELDSSELYYFGARYYDPSLGRFLSPDTQLASHIYQTDTFNRFAFVVNNPVSYIDPTGHNIFHSLKHLIHHVAHDVSHAAHDIIDHVAHDINHVAHDISHVAHDVEKKVEHVTHVIEQQMITTGQEIEHTVVKDFKHLGSESKRVAGAIIGVGEVIGGVGLFVVSVGNYAQLSEAIVAAGTEGLTYSTFHKGSFSWKEFGNAELNGLPQELPQEPPQD